MSDSEIAKHAKVVVVMPAYNAAKTIERTYADIPAGVVDHIILVDDVSQDETVEIARHLGLEVIVHVQNRGYGGNQKTCYLHALAADADIVVMLHPDYQYDSRLVRAPRDVDPPAVPAQGRPGRSGAGVAVLGQYVGGRDAAVQIHLESLFDDHRESRPAPEFVRVSYRFPRVQSSFVGDDSVCAELGRFRIRYPGHRASRRVRIQDCRNRRADALLSGSIVGEFSAQCRLWASDLKDARRLYSRPDSAQDPSAFSQETCRGHQSVSSSATAPRGKVWGCAIGLDTGFVRVVTLQ